MAHIDECGHCHEVEQKHIAAAKRDLAVKVLAVIVKEERSRFGEGATGISSVVRDLFTTEGVVLEGRDDD